MANNGSQQKYNFVCYKCGRIVAPGENMLTISVSLETPDVDGSIRVKESTAISSLCASCASLMTFEGMFKEDPNWMDLPDGALVSSAFEEVEEEE